MLSFHIKTKLYLYFVFSIIRHGKFINNLSKVINTSGQALIYLTTHMIQQEPFPGLISFTRLNTQCLLIEVTEGSLKITLLKPGLNEIFMRLISIKKKKDVGGEGGAASVQTIKKSSSMVPSHMVSKHDF